VFQAAALSATSISCLRLPSAFTPASGRASLLLPCCGVRSDVEDRVFTWFCGNELVLLLTLLSDHSEQLGRETSRLQPIVGVVEFSAGSISSA
jgi:hypothetical protein